MDDQNNNADAPDGDAANEAIRDKHRSDRSEIEKAILRRDTAIADVRTRDERIALLQSELASFKKTGGKPDGKPQPAPTTNDAAAMPEWAQALVQQVTALDSKLDTHQTSAARTSVEAKVLSEVPDGNHATAKALLGTLGVDFTQPGAAADALAKLRENHSAVMVDHTRGNQPRAPAMKPDGSPSFDAYKTFDEVPDAFKPAAMRDPETFERLRGGGGASHGLNI